MSSAVDTAATTTTTANTTITTTDLVPHQLALLDTIAALGATSGRSSNSEGFVSPTAEEMPAVTVVNMNTNEEHIKGLMKQIQQLVSTRNEYSARFVMLKVESKYSRCRWFHFVIIIFRQPSSTPMASQPLHCIIMTTVCTILDQKRGRNF